LHLGGVISVTARTIYENPFSAVVALRSFAKTPDYDVYMTPAAIAFLANGLNIEAPPVKDPQ
jgi:hypothetical protein